MLVMSNLLHIIELLIFILLSTTAVAFEVKHGCIFKVS